MYTQAYVYVHEPEHISPCSPVLRELHNKDRSHIVHRLNEKQVFLLFYYSYISPFMHEIIIHKYEPFSFALSLRAGLPASAQ